MKRAILSITVTHPLDDSPDLSYLGEYSDTASSPQSIDRDKLGDKGRGEYRYFNPSFNYDDETPRMRAKYTRQDYARMEAYNRGEWCCVGVIAEATVRVGDGPLQRIFSGGLWGIETDFEKSYLRKVGEEQVAELREQLEALGFTPAELAEVEVEWP